MADYERKNTVCSDKQVSKYVSKLGDGKGKPVIMFLGNSITKHDPAPQIGWYGNWGMAASAAEKDYVHICMKEITHKYPEASFYLVQGSAWERSYRDCDFDKFFRAAKGIDPDFIICLISENITNEDFDAGVFIEQFRRLHKYLSGKNENTRIIAVSNFFANKRKTEAIHEYAEKYEAAFVYVSDMINDKENLAGEYKHDGIKIHPGDKGMELIAKRIMHKFNSL